MTRYCGSARAIAVAFGFPPKAINHPMNRTKWEKELAGPQASNSDVPLRGVPGEVRYLIAAAKNSASYASIT